MDKDKQAQSKMTRRDITDLTMIKIFVWRDVGFTAENLLSMSLPFGNVISVQKIVRYGFTKGLVTYFNANDAATAMRTLNRTTDFLVALSHPREIQEAHENERSESPFDKPPSLLQDGFSDMPPQRIHRLMDTLYPPAYSQSVSLSICNLPRDVNQRYQLLSLLPPSTTNVKVERKRALVMLPDFSTALWLVNLLNGRYFGHKRLQVFFANQGFGARRARRAAHRKHHHHHQGLL